MQGNQSLRMGCITLETDGGQGTEETCFRSVTDHLEVSEKLSGAGLAIVMLIKTVSSTFRSIENGIS